MSLVSISKSALAVLLAVSSVSACPPGSRHSQAINAVKPGSNTTGPAPATQPGSGSTAPAPATQPGSGTGPAPAGQPTFKTGMISAGYFAGFHAKRSKAFNVEQIPWSKYTDVKYSFAETASDGSLDYTGSHEEEIPKFVKAAHANGVKAQLAIGGWSGSIHWGNNVATAANRTAFVKTCLDAVKKYDLDGLDFDWEYPGRKGLSCNTVSPEDSLNFIEFLKELRKAEPKKLWLSAAVSLFPYTNKEGQRSANNELAPMAELLDYSMIMGYDVFGAWAATGGPNAPLSFACDSKRNNQG
ncbi:acidic mammalian chitinase, partial [Magnaporthiopsis poae ATCC 64411]